MPKPAQPQKKSPIKKRVPELDRILMSSLLFVMAAVTFVEVVARFIFRTPLSHIGEAVPNLFVWMTFLGVAVAEKENAHLGISFSASHAMMLNKILRIVTVSGKGLFFLILALYGFRFVFQSFSRGEMTSFGIPAWVFLLAVPAGSLLIVIRILLSGNRRSGP